MILKPKDGLEFKTIKMNNDHLSRSEQIALDRLNEKLHKKFVREARASRCKQK